ncbi:glutathione S-transferase family protein [Jannaschia pohangensis]|uniref:Glutathione S-transferase n=1 Tax=Jannaschia pohangensis TaxID=390807 RepID=A0A1I3I7W3_9RHOB|nr:glutathione S-transferase [Jannaschia pohangensis]SFI44002.1 glutathione S-transferase [Jannaschia pohangensis]
MTLTLFLARGTISMSVHAALEEAGLPHDLNWVDFSKNDQRDPAYLAINPKGRVPTLIAPEGTLTEAGAILQWIATQSPGLMPDDPWQAAKLREVMFYLASTAHVAHAHKMRGHRWADDPAAQAAMTAKVPQTMTDCATWLEDRLSGDWLGAAFSVADLYLWNVALWLPGDNVDMTRFPKLAAHSARVAARPAVARVIALHDG